MHPYHKYLIDRLNTVKSQVAKYISLTSYLTNGEKYFFLTLEGI